MRPRKTFTTILLATLAILIPSTLAAILVPTISYRGFFYRETEAALVEKTGLLLRLFGVKCDLSAGIDTADAVEFCAEEGLGESMRVTIVAPDGVVLGDSLADPARMDNHGNRPEILMAQSGANGVVIRPSDTLGVDMMYYAAPIVGEGELEGYLRVAIGLSVLDDELATLWLRLGILGGLLACLGTGAAFFAARRIAKPLARLVRAAEAFAEGRFEERIEINGDREIMETSTRMNRMAALLSSRWREIQRQRASEKAILGGMTDGVIAIDGEGVVITINRSAAGLFRTSVEEAVGRRMESVVTMKGVFDFTEKLSTRNEPMEEEITHYGAKQSLFRLQGTPLYAPDIGAIGILVVIQDVTRFRELDAMRRDFAANAGHELRTPLTSITGFVETLREAVGKDGAFRKGGDEDRFLGIIGSQAARLSSLIDDLLVLSRIEHRAMRGEIDTEFRPLRPTLEESIEALQINAQRKRIELLLDCPADLVVVHDAALLGQAVTNLVDNAIKYSEPGKSVWIVAGKRTLDGRESVEIAVADQGFGIAEEHFARLFERFYRVDKARSREMGGTGLGLAIVKHIVLAHGGSVGVQSRPGQGSTFTILIPAEASTDGG